MSRKDTVLMLLEMLEKLVEETSRAGLMASSSALATTARAADEMAKGLRVQDDYRRGGA